MNRRTVLRRIEIGLHLLVAAAFIGFFAVALPVRQGILAAAGRSDDASVTYVSQGKAYELTAGDLSTVEAIDRYGFLALIAVVVMVVAALVIRHLINEADRLSSAAPPP